MQPIATIYFNNVPIVLLKYINELLKNIKSGNNSDFKDLLLGRQQAGTPGVQRPQR